MPKHVQTGTPAAGDLSGTYPNPTLISVGTAGTSGATNSTPVITTDSKGRVTALTPVSIAITESQVIGLTADLSVRPIDNTLVHLANAETITGAKNFSVMPLISAGTPAAGKVFISADGSGTGSWAYPGLQTTYNYVPNPSFENATYNLNWGNYGSVGTRAADTTNFQFGTQSYQQVNGTALDGGIQSSTIALAAGTYTFSAYAKISSAVVNANMVVRTNPGSAVLGQVNQTYPGNTNFNRYSFSFVMASAGNVEILLGQGSYGLPSMGTVNYDGVQIENSAAATTYLDGSLAASGYYVYSWAGTAHNSTSSRSYMGPLSTTDYLPEGVAQLYFTPARSLAAITNASISPTVANVYNLYANGTFGLAITSTPVTGAITLGNNGSVLCNASSGAFTVTLPAASSRGNVIYHIKKTDSSANAVTVSGAQNIDGASTYPLPVQWNFVVIQSNGTQWYIIGKG